MSRSSRATGKRKKSKPMKCHLLIVGGNTRRRSNTPHVRFERMISLENVGEIVSYLSQFRE